MLLACSCAYALDFWDPHFNTTSFAAPEDEVHKPLFKPFIVMDAVGTFVIIVMMALATMGGIGGGGVIVLLITELLRFNFDQATALSGFSILTCSTVRFIITYKQRHPEKDTVALDYGLAAVMMPAVLIGSFLGLLLSPLLPELVKQIVLALVLFFLTFQAGIKARQLYQKENKVLKA